MDAEPPSQPESPNGYPPADLRRRVVARAIDSGVVALVFALLLQAHQPLAATLCSAALIFCGDRLFGPGRSLGKRLLGLRVVVLRTKQPGGITASMRRNVFFTLAILPSAAGTPGSFIWALAATALATAVETSVSLSPLTRDLGRRRLGDLLADTQVIDASIALGLSVLALPTRAPPAAAISASHRHAA